MLKPLLVTVAVLTFSVQVFAVTTPSSIRNDAQLKKALNGFCVTKVHQKVDQMGVAALHTKTDAYCKCVTEKTLAKMKPEELETIRNGLLRKNKAAAKEWQSERFRKKGKQLAHQCKRVLFQ